MGNRGTKPCIKCGVLDKDKYNNCRPCAHKASKKYRMANLQKAKESGKKWREKNPEKVKNRHVKYRANNKEKRRLYNIKWRTENSQKKKQYDKEWRVANSEKQKLCVAKWRKANPDAHRIYDQNRSSRKKKNGGKLSTNLAEILYKRQKGKCVCCKKLLGKDYHLDHIMPLALGGKNENWNIQLLRAKCNLQKNAKHPIEYMQSRGFLL